jgi:hypothetical protein
METWVFAGRDLDPSESEPNLLYFQDVESYRDGIRYSSTSDCDAKFQVQPADQINHVFEYENALNELMKCSLARQKAAGRK